MLYVLMEVLLTRQCEKENKRLKGFKFRTIIGRFQVGIMAVKGLSKFFVVVFSFKRFSVFCKKNRGGGGGGQQPGTGKLPVHERQMRFQCCNKGGVGLTKTEGAGARSLLSFWAFY